MERDLDLEVAFEKKTWADARAAFEASGHDPEKYSPFLKSYSSPDDAKQLITKSKSEVGAQYGDKVGKILEKVNVAMSMGDIAIKSAPESVGLAWMGVRMCLNAFQDDYATFQLFSGACSDIVGVLISCRVYARAYSCKDRPPQFDELHDLVIGHVVATYTTIIEFSYQMWKHTQTKVAFRLAKGLFRNAHTKFQGLIESLRSNENQMNKYAEQASDQTLRYYQQKGLSNDRTIIQDLSSLRGVIEQFERDREARDEEWKQLLEAQSKNETKRSGLEQAHMNLDRQLELLLGSTGHEQEDALVGKIKARQPNTCQWILERDEFKDQGSAIWLVGAGGTGKSFLMATMIEALQNQSMNKDLALSYCFITSGSELSREPIKILQLLLAQVYSCARGNMDILDSCNALVQVYLEEQAVRDKTPSAANATLNQQAFTNALVKMIRTVDQRACISVDALDEMVEAARILLITVLKETKHQLGQNLQLIMSSRDSSKTASALSDFAVISVEEHNASDISYHINKEIDKLPGFTISERTEVCATIATKAGYDFNYIRLAVDYMRRPWQRPLSSHLATLPAGINDIYAQRLRQLDPAYHRLLKACLQWVLLAQRPLHVRELMDIDNDVFRLADESGEPVEFDARLLDQYKEQIQYAGSAFLRISANDTVVPVHNTVREFFLSSASSGQNIEKELSDCSCARCQRELRQTPDFSINEIESHMNIAITLLRQLLSPSFRAIHCILRIRESSSSEGSEDESSYPRSSSGDRSKSDRASSTSSTKRHDDAAQSSPSRSRSRSSSSSRLPDFEEPIRSPIARSPIARAVSPRSVKDSDVRSRATTTSVDESLEDLPDWLNDLPSHETRRYGFGHLLWHLQRLEQTYPLEDRRGETWDTLRILLLEFCQPSSPAWNAFIDTMSRSSRPDFDLPGWHRDLRNEDTVDPVIVAAEAGLDSLLSLLLDNDERKAAINDTIGHQYCALYYAVESQQFWPVTTAPIFSRLLVVGADPNLRCGGNTETPFTLLITKQSASDESVRLFLSHGADMFVVSCAGDYPIHKFARGEAGINVAKALFDAGADPNHPNENGDTPMHSLCRRYLLSLDVVQEFVSRGARIDEENDQSERPLIWSVRHRFHQYAKILISLGADINDIGKFGCTALMVAALTSHECVDILLEAGADPSIRDEDGLLPLANACGNLDGGAEISICQAMIARGTAREILEPDKHGKTIFMKAVASDKAELITLLLQHFGKKDFLTQQTEKGWQALHFGASNASINAVRILLENGADSGAMTVTRQTPLDLCHEIISQKPSINREDTIICLAEHDPDSVVKNVALMHTLVSFNSLRTVEKLLQLGADPLTVNTDGWNALTLAESYGWADMLSLLKKYKRVSSSSVDMKFTVWNQQGFRISEDGLEITPVEPESFRPRGLFLSNIPIPVNAKTFYFEIRLTKTDSQGYTASQNDPILIGLCRKPQKHNKLGILGQSYHRSPDCWCYSVQDGWIRSVVNSRARQRQDATGYAPGEYHYRPGDVVGCLLEIENRTVTFTKDGFKLSCEPLHKLYGPVHAMFTIPMGCDYHFEANFGNNLPKKPFLFDVDNPKEAPHERTYGSESDSVSEHSSNDQKVPNSSIPTMLPGTIR